MPDEYKIRENRLRRMAERQGVALVKSRRRDPRALDYGKYMIVDPTTTGIVQGAGSAGPCMDLDDVEAWLTTPGQEEERGKPPLSERGRVWQVR